MNHSKMQVSILGILILFVFSFYSCQHEAGSPSKAETKDTTASSDSKPAREIPSRDLRFTWVDPLNVRATPNPQGEIVAKVTPLDTLEATGKTSEQTETIVLRGVAYDSPWLKVKLPDQKEGWVFGGAVRRKGETKGNDPITSQQFDFPHFGQFDLSTWQDMGTKEESAGDAETFRATYRNGEQIFELISTGVGDYGYSRTYQLLKKTPKGREVLKERVFAFSAGDQVHELIETVTDFTTHTPLQYQRQQKIKVHFSQLNARPLMVDGVWTRKTLSDEE